MSGSSPSTDGASEAPSIPQSAAAERQRLSERFHRVRQQSLDLCAPLEAEDYRIQSIADVSPPWWNLGHTSWFFSKNILEPRGLATDLDRQLEFVLNSYYETHGERLERASRGNVSRPTTEQVLRFRSEVDDRLEGLIRSAEPSDFATIAFLVEAGIQHEQQHQELLLTEVKHILGSNPRELRSPYCSAPPAPATKASAIPFHFVDFEATLCEAGTYQGDPTQTDSPHGWSWAWDNERPRHRRFLEAFSLGNRLITNREYLEFMQDGGYQRALLWLSAGWTVAQQQRWQAPLYWYPIDGEWHRWTLAGDQPLTLDELTLDEPVEHVSFYEANAFAQWKSETDEEFAGARLPTEFELELAAERSGFVHPDSNFVEQRHMRPLAVRQETQQPRANGATGRVQQLAGDLWEWTTSHYEPYPGYRPFAGDLMEYNGKFMDNQRILRGGSYGTPADHIRPTYRNFWPADTRFQFTGIRLARS